RRFDLARGEHHDSLWIDERGLIRRARSEHKGRLGTQRDVRYERRHGIDLPVSWASVNHAPSGAGRTETAVEVVEAKVHVPVADAESEVRFPPGAKAQGEGGKEYVAQPDGSLRDLKPPPQEPGFLSRHRVLLYCCLAVLFLLLAGYVARRRGRGRPLP